MARWSVRILVGTAEQICGGCKMSGGGGGGGNSSKFAPCKSATTCEIRAPNPASVLALHYFDDFAHTAVTSHPPPATPFLACALLLYFMHYSFFPQRGNRRSLVLRLPTCALPLRAPFFRLRAFTFFSFPPSLSFS